MMNVITSAPASCIEEATGLCLMSSANLSSANLWTKSEDEPSLKASKVSKSPKSPKSPLLNGKRTFLTFYVLALFNFEVYLSVIRQ